MQTETTVRFHGAHRHNGTNDVASHAHPYAEIIYVVQGALQTRVGDQHLDISPGMAQIVPAGTRHDQTGSPSWSTICILYEDDPRQQAALPALADLRGDFQARRWIEDIVDWHQALDFEPQSRRAAQSVCSGLLTALLAAIRHASDRQESARRLHPALTRALNHLHSIPTLSISHDELAAEAGVSSRYLTTIFHQRFAMGPGRYQQHLRMEIACRSLRNPYATIAESAALAGYDDPNYFGRLFRKVHGVSPGEWRRRNCL